MTQQPEQFPRLTLDDGTERAYHKIQPGEGAEGLPEIVFLAGHGSDMLGSKAEAIAEYASEKGFGFLRFDYFGHGQSDGSLQDGNLSIWVADALAMMDRLTSGRQILIGSSLGGWVMLRLAQERPQHIAGLIGIAAAPDFTERLIWDQLDAAGRKAMQDKGFLAVENPYADEDVIYSYDLITDGRRNLVLDSTLDIDVPVFLHHGCLDEEVPYQTALDIADTLSTSDCTIILDKMATHRYSETKQIQALIASIDQIYASFEQSE